MACTIRIAVERAKFGQPAVKLGLLPGGGGTQRLPRLVGKGRALQLIVSGGMISAQEAYRIGLVNEVVQAADLIPRAESILKQIAANAPIAVKYALEATNKGMDTSQSEGFALEASYFGLCAGTEDKTEGTAAFLEKRAPQFHVADRESRRLQESVLTADNGNPAISEFRFTSSDGLLIACARWSHRGPLRGIVQIAHGMGEHIGRYGETIDALTSAGLIVYGNAHRGHGLTALPTGDFGDFGPGGFDLLVEDMVLLSHHIAKHERPNTPFFLLGHSLGSFAAQQFVLDHSRNIDGLILSGSSVLDGLARLARSAPAIGDFLNFDFDPARTPFDWLSRDDAVVDAFLMIRCASPSLPAAFASFLAAASRLSDPVALGRIRRDRPSTSSQAARTQSANTSRECRR
jgi:alpha-beta hydrolase superfamily lysophospholipase